MPLLPPVAHLDLDSHEGRPGTFAQSTWAYVVIHGAQRDDVRRMYNACGARKRSAQQWSSQPPSLSPSPRCPVRSGFLIRLMV
eukprot:8345876-Pyramimonas_sp.AAC.1